MLAAKILVISRRIHRFLAQCPEGVVLVSDLHDQLASLRRKLLRQIDRQLSMPHTKTSQLVQLMCAFSLATSASLTDVLKHFHHIRLLATTSVLEPDPEDDTKTLQAFALYSQTLRDTQTVLPKPIMESLLKLKSRPLLQDAELRAVVELNLDLYETWIPDEISDFTPWIGHDDLQKHDAERLLLAWAKQAFTGLLESLGRRLGSMEDFQALVQLRTKILKSWFDGRHQVMGFASEEPLQALRDVINKRLLGLAQAKAHDLHLVAQEIKHVIHDWNPEKTDGSDDLWASSTLSMDLSNGAEDFKKAILDRTHGRDPAVRRVMASYNAWLVPVEGMFKNIKDLRDQKWDEDLDEDDDELGLESRNVHLSQDDPDAVQQALNGALAMAFQDLQGAVEEGMTLMTSHDDLQSIFLLRVLREIRRRLPKQDDVSNFGLRLVPRLHAIVAKRSMTPCLDDYGTLLEHRLFRSSPPLPLWEGSPPLPVQPSASVFQLLHSLAKRMATDADVWSRTAVGTLKTIMREEVLDLIGKVLEKGGGQGDDGTVNGASDIDESADDTRRANAMTQLLFDILLLRIIFNTDEPSSSSEVQAMERLIEQVTKQARIEPASSEAERLHKNTVDCWKRVGLLFGILR